VNISLELKRAEEDRRLTALVVQIALEQGYEINDRAHRVKVADPQALRGLPAVGPLSAGSAIAGTQPGTDAHLEKLG
jgi:hypothetical protein